MAFSKTLTQAALCMAVGLASTQATATVVVSNPLNGTIAWNPLGEPDTTTYGQTFRTPDAINTRLDAFSFWIRSLGEGISRLSAYVAEWTGSGITGPLLFAGSPFEGNYADFTEISIDTGGIALDAGKQYVAFFSAAGLFDDQSDAVQMGTNNFTDTYSGGDFVWDNSNGVFPGANWNGCLGCTDVAFRLVFSEMNGNEGNSVPEPATLALLGLGLAGLGALRRKARP